MPTIISEPKNGFPEALKGDPFPDLLILDGTSQFCLPALAGPWHIEAMSRVARDVTFGADHSHFSGAGRRPKRLHHLKASGHRNVAACRIHAAQQRAALKLLGIARAE